MKRLTGSIILIIFACILAVFSCSAPVGFIDGNNGGPGIVGDTDYMWAVPYRDTYDVRDVFVRSTDLSVIASARGMLQNIPTDQVEISIIEDPDWGGEEILVPTDEYYAFTSEGRKVVVVRYSGLSARYSVQVNDPFGLGGTDPGGPGGPGDGGGINILWGCDKHGLNPCVFCCPRCYKLKDDCRCPCNDCNRYPCICCPQCKTAPGDCNCGNCGRNCACPCPDCGTNPCGCTCGECGHLLANCICCKYCEKVVCECPCWHCGRDPCVCPCPVCGSSSTCGGTCGDPLCKCCSTCKTIPCKCCKDCGKFPCECLCDECGLFPCECCQKCGKVNCECPCDTCGRYPCQCCQVCGQFHCVCPSPIIGIKFSMRVLQ